MALLKDVTLGTLSYNGWTFDAMHKSKATNKVVLDDAGRLVKWQEVTIDVEAKVDLAGYTDNPDYPTFNSVVVAMKRALSEPGGTLIYNNKGFGNLYVNSSESSVRDVNWGPKPEVIEFVPVGGNQAVYVHFKITTCIVNCDSAVFRRHIFNLTYEGIYDLDPDGYLTFTVNGAYEIPLTFSTNDGAGGPLNVIDSADTWWGQVCPVVKNGFKRVTKNRRVSRDRRRVEFTIADKELPVPLPPGCTMMEAKHKIRNENMGFQIWSATINGTVRVSRELPRSAAFEKAWLLLASRMTWARTHQGQPAVVTMGPPNPITGGLGVTQGPRASGVLMTQLEIEEDVFGIDMRFSCTYRIIGAQLETILHQSGLWLPVPETSHAQWRQSMRLINEPYGVSGAIFGPDQDVMIDLCGGPAARRATTPVPAPARDTIRNPAFDYQRTPASLLGADGGDEAFFFSPEFSWLSYNATLHFLEEDEIVRHKPLAGNVTIQKPKAIANGSVGPHLHGTGSNPLLATWDTPDILQRISSPGVTVILSGTAMRFGYRIDTPRLLRFGGRDVTQVRAFVSESMVGNIQGIPIFGLAWRIEYALTEPPRDMSLLANPLYATNGLDRSNATNAPINFNNTIG